MGAFSWPFGDLELRESCYKDTPKVSVLTPPPILALVPVFRSESHVRCRFGSFEAALVKTRPWSKGRKQRP